MNLTRTIQSPRKSSPRDTRPFIYLFKIEFPNDPPKRIRKPESIKELLRIATDILELQRPAKNIYDSYLDPTTPITDIDSIEPKTKLYISCAAATQPISKDLADIDNENIYKNRLPRQSRSSILLMRSKSPSRTKSPGRSKSPSAKSKEKRKDIGQQCAIAACSVSVKDNFRNAILSLYNSLSEDHKNSMSISPTLSKLTTDTQLATIDKTLANNYMGPITSLYNDQIQIDLQNWVSDQLKCLLPEELKFAIVGPSQSGKSTILSLATRLFFHKLQITNETKNYLLFPVNWLLQQIYLDDITKIYSLFITTTLKILQNIRMELIPIIQPFKQWLLSLISNQIIPSPPPQILHYTNFPHEKVIELAKSIHDKWSNVDGFREFLLEVVNFPNNLAKVFGFKSAIYVYDHFDCAIYEISPDEHFTSDNLIKASTPVVLSELLCEAISTTPFFVASQHDDDFFNAFMVEDYKQLSTERIIQNVSFEQPEDHRQRQHEQNPQTMYVSSQNSDESSGLRITFNTSHKEPSVRDNQSVSSSQGKQSYEIYVQNPSFVLTIDSCRGCPVYCAMFRRVYQMADEVTQINKNAKKGQTLRLRSKADISRDMLLKHEFLRMCILLATADTDDVFNEDMINEMLEMKDLVIRTR